MYGVSADSSGRVYRSWGTACMLLVIVYGVERCGFSDV